MTVFRRHPGVEVPGTVCPNPLCALLSGCVSGSENPQYHTPRCTAPLCGSPVCATPPRPSGSLPKGMDASLPFLSIQSCFLQSTGATWAEARREPNCGGYAPPGLPPHAPVVSELSSGGFVGHVSAPENTNRVFLKALAEDTQVFSPVRGPRKFIAWRA